MWKKFFEYHVSHNCTDKAGVSIIFFRWSDPWITDEEEVSI